MDWLDWQKVHAFQLCPQRYNLRYNLNLVGVRAPVGASYGSACHTWLQAWYDTFDVAKAKAAFQAVWQDQEGEKVRTLARGLELIDEYAAHFPTEPFKILATEQQVELPSSIVGIPYRMRIDALVDDGGIRRVLEHKTMKYMADKWTHAFRPNRQLCGYIVGAREHLKVECDSALIVGIQIAKPRPDKNTGEVKKVFGRHRERFTPEDLYEWRMAVADALNGILLYDKVSRWPQYDNCTHYGECPYRMLCNNPKLKDGIIAQYYREEVWNPFETHK